jgi:hypothetical protein
VYIDQNNRVWIIDFNSFGNPTCALLFEWHELLAIASSFSSAASIDGLLSPEFRFIKNETEKLTSVMGSKRGPVDVHLSNEFANFLEICKNQNNDVDEDY